MDVFSRYTTIPDRQPPRRRNARFRCANCMFPYFRNIIKLLSPFHRSISPEPRRYGGVFHADLHVQVSRGLSVAEGHAIGHAVRDAVRAAGIGVVDAVVHVEPEKAQLGEAAEG